MDISQILSSLSEEDMKNLQGLASSLMSGETQEKKTESAQEQNSGSAGLDLNALGGMASLLSAFSGPSDDPRCRLIASLKPMLSSERQQRADEAIKIIKLMDMLPLLKDSGLFSGGLFGG